MAYPAFQPPRRGTRTYLPQAAAPAPDQAAGAVEQLGYAPPRLTGSNDPQRLALEQSIDTLPDAPQPVSLQRGVGQPANFGDKLASLLGRGVNNAGTLLGQAGQAIKNDPLGAVNAGLGIAGAMEYATARAPQLPGKPDYYAPFIRPAQGLNPTSLSSGRAQIQAAQRQNSRSTTSDAGSGVAQRLFAQAQAGQQQNELSLKDNEAFQQDQRRIDEQQNQAYQANYTTQRSYKEKVFDLGQRAYEARRQQGGAMSQAALTYFTQARADKLNGIERGKEAALYAQLGIAPGGQQRRASSATVQPVEAQAKGGKFKFSLRQRATSGDKFGERQARLTEQAQNLFAQSVREASKLRSKGLRG